MQESHHLLTLFVTASVLGVLLTILSQRIRVSAIVVLLIGGILAGPSVLGLIHPQDLGAGLRTIISLAVALVLFEGGLSLEVRGYRQVSKEIWGVLTKGVLITWSISAILIKIFFGFSWTFSVLAASLIIVTGPTTIGPLLQRIRVTKNIHHILHWEGVLIDPIGVFLALLAYEWTLSSTMGGTPYLNFVYRFLVGLIIGLAFGAAIYQVLKREWVPEENLNIFVLAAAMFNFMVADNLISESGLLSVTITGLILGYKRTPKLDRIIQYKVELKNFLIGLLFILLAAQLDLTSFSQYGTPLIWVVVLVMFLVRPLNIFLSLYRSSLTLREKLFLGWVAPRGIVAASMASLFALQLGDMGIENAAFIETLTYSVIAGTVVFQGFTAKAVGRLLGVLEPKPRDWLIVGAHRLGREVAAFIQARGEGVVLMDTNARDVQVARREGFNAYLENAMVFDPEHHPEDFYSVGNVLTITINEDLNQRICQRWGHLIPLARLYRWTTGKGVSASLPESLNAGEPVWSGIHLSALLAKRGKDAAFQFETIQINDQNAEERPNVLIYAQNNNLYFNPAEKTEDEILALVLRLPQSLTAFPLSRQRVLVKKNAGIEELLEEMLASLQHEFPAINVPALLDELMLRKEEYINLLGHGVSLPHTYTRAVNQTQLAVALVKDPIPWPEKELEVKLVFLLLSPPNKPVEHLNQISKIAGFVVDEAKRQALFAATDAETLYLLLTSEDATL